MCPGATGRWNRYREIIPLLSALAVLFISPLASAQPLPGARPEWRRIGNTVVDGSLASPAGGPVLRVWYSENGFVLYLQTGSGKVYETNDFENWIASSAAAPPRLATTSSPTLPESAAQVSRSTAPGSTQFYALGKAVYASQDRGTTWISLTQFRGQSIIGEGLNDLAVSPRDGDEIAVAGQFGVWRSMDGGITWTGANETLPNLPLRRLARTPGSGVSARAVIQTGDNVAEVEWVAGHKAGWIPVEPDLTATETAVRQRWSETLGLQVVASASSADFVYAGGIGGRLWSSADSGRTWRPFYVAGGGNVESIHVLDGEPRTALASLATGDGGARLVRTINGGLFWDDITSNLPPGSVHAAAADLKTGAIYAATDAGLFYTVNDLRAAAGATPWLRLPGLPEAAAYDVKLDALGNQLFAALDGHGVFAAMAPHRFLAPRVVNAADYSVRAAAPGGLLSVLGRRVASARAGTLELPVLAATDAESQIQVPFEAAGTSLELALTTSSAGRLNLPVPLRTSSPAIFTDRDGMPIVLDADLGVLLDAMTPARAGARIQILATGLGRVVPEWPTGLAAPLENPPRVAETVRVYLDRAQLRVIRATLTPGYIGFYLIEVEIPDIVDNGPAELYVESSGESSARVSIYLSR